MDPNDPRHGERKGYIAGCREDCCRKPHVRYQKRSTLRRHREGSQVVDATPVLERLNWWADHGISRNALHRAADLGEGTLAELCLGERTVIYKSNARKVLAVTWDDLPGSALCNAPLTLARIRSMMAAGHPLQWIADNAPGISVGGKWRYQSRVTLRLARSVQSLYATAPLTGPSKITAVKARNSGALHPFAWEDLPAPAAPKGWSLGLAAAELDAGIDYVVVERIVAGHRVEATAAERTAACGLALKRGISLTDLGRRAGFKPERYFKIGDAA